MLRYRVSISKKDPKHEGPLSFLVLSLFDFAVMNTEKCVDSDLYYLLSYSDL